MSISREAAIEALRKEMKSWDTSGCDEDGNFTYEASQGANVGDYYSISALASAINIVRALPDG